jgi:hypothetical protein
VSSIAFLVSGMRCFCCELETAASLEPDLYRSDARDIVSTMPDAWKREQGVKSLMERLRE